MPRLHNPDDVPLSEVPDDLRLLYDFEADGRFCHEAAPGLLRCYFPADNTWEKGTWDGDAKNATYAVPKDTPVYPAWRLSFAEVLPDGSGKIPLTLEAVGSHEVLSAIAKSLGLTHYRIYDVFGDIVEEKKMDLTLAGIFGQQFLSE